MANAGIAVSRWGRWEDEKIRQLYPRAPKPEVLAALPHHVVPLSRGGEHSLANLLPACFRCNHSKKNKTVAEWAASGVPHNPFLGKEE